MLTIIRPLPETESPPPSADNTPDSQYVDCTGNQVMSDDDTTDLTDEHFTKEVSKKSEKYFIKAADSMESEK